MNFITPIHDSLRTMMAELFAHRQQNWFRQSVALAGVVLGLALLVCCLPIREGRPVFDVAVMSARTAGHVLDACGVVHHLSDDGLTLAQSGGTTDVGRIAGLGFLAMLMIPGCLVWGLMRTHSLGLSAVAFVGTVMTAAVANIAALCTTLLVCNATGLIASVGLGWMLTFGLRVTFAVGLLLALLSTIDWLWARWEFRSAVRRCEELGELPHPIDFRFRRLSIGLGGILVCGIGVWLVGRSQTDQNLITIYREIAESSLTAGDVVTANVAVERLLQLDPQAVPHRYLQARLLESHGKSDAAESLVRELVNAGDRRFEPAHRWLARHIAKQREDRNVDQNRAGSAGGQSADVVSAGYSSIDAHLRQAEAYLARRSPEQAIREVEQIVDQRPDLRLTLARLSILAGQPDAARLHAELAKSFYEDELASAPLSLDARMHLAATDLFLEQFNDALMILLKGWELTREAAYQHALSDAYLVWQDTAARQGAPVARQLNLLEKALKYDPTSPLLLRRVAVLATQEQQTGPAISLLTRALADRPIPASVHFILGTYAYRHGRVENALLHLEEAYRLDPQNVEILNNLAWVLAESDPDSLERAVELAHQAIRLNPRSASIRETRGQIFARLGQWTQAVADLENALQVMQENPAIHATLADAYEHLGDPTLAAEHRRLAGERQQRQ